VPSSVRVVIILTPKRKTFLDIGYFCVLSDIYKRIIFIHALIIKYNKLSFKYAWFVLLFVVHTHLKYPTIPNHYHCNMNHCS